MGNHVFICYARKDQDFVLRLAANLKEQGVPVWLDQWDIPASADWDLTIDNALYGCARFLITLSPAAVDSREVRGELRTALDENKPIVPVLYQMCRIPRQLRLIQHVDFTSCGPDDETALAEVLRALEVSEPPPPTPEVRRREEAAPARQPFEPEMILIPAGEFLMGSDPRKDKDARDEEQPQHSLYLPDYTIARTPVTNAQFARFIEDGGYRRREFWTEAGWRVKEKEGWTQPHYWTDKRFNLPSQPVVGVSWYEALAYARWTGGSLPSEAEWEKAAGWDPRTGVKRRYPWGNEWDLEKCNLWEKGSGLTTPVGQYSPAGDSPYGLADMIGNVWEWCRSRYGRYPYDPDDGREDLEGDAPRVVRGGTFSYSRRLVHRADHRRFDRTDRVRLRGVRLVGGV